MQSILVVEDEALIRKSICEILSLKGYKAVGAANGLLGLERAKEIKPDLVLCDIIMPKLSGLQMLKSIRKTPDLEHIPFIFLTALSAMADVRKGMNTGADDYLTKPFDHNELISVVAQQLKKARIRGKNYLKKGEIGLKKKDETQPPQDVNGIYDSLKRAKFIQDVILPNEKQMQAAFEQHFVYYAPKDTISGDFYCVKKIKDITLIAVADCTGHGVPGALMTMVCYSKLTESIEQYGLTRPGEILEKVNQLVIEFMRKNQAGKCDDGMDISLCAIDESRRTISFAGAKQSLLLVTRAYHPQIRLDENIKDYHGNGAKLYKIRGSHYSIGNCEASRFSETCFNYEDGDLLYLNSDGYSDQFGGVKNRKFKTRNLINLLFTIQNFNLERQRDLIVQQHEHWKGSEEQTDDITVIGIRL